MTFSELAADVPTLSLPILVVSADSGSWSKANPESDNYRANIMKFYRCGVWNIEAVGEVMKLVPGVVVMVWTALSSVRDGTVAGPRIVK